MSEEPKPNPISIHPPQREIWLDEARFKVVVAGRRMGKTFLIREQLLYRSEIPNSINIYVAPTRQQAKTIIWSSLKDRVAELKWKVKINEAELKVTRLSNGSVIQLFSAEKPGRIRGLGLDFVALDEFAEYRDFNELWFQVVRPALSDKRGDALFTATPRGFNHAYELFNQAKVEQDWASFTYKTIDSPFFQTPEGRKELDDAKRNLTDRDYRQEYEASFENFSGRIYYGFDRGEVYTNYTYNQDLPLIVGLDFNKSPYTATMMQKVNGILHQHDEFWLEVGDTPEFCRMVQERYSNKNVIIRPDATGSRSYSVARHLSDHAILREHGFKVEVRNTNPYRIDRWAAVNRALEKGLYKINTARCPRTVKDFETLCYKEGSSEPDLSDKMLGHISDGAGYAVHWEFPIMGQVSQRSYA